MCAPSSFHYFRRRLIVLHKHFFFFKYVTLVRFYSLFSFSAIRFTGGEPQQRRFCLSRCVLCYGNGTNTNDTQGPKHLELRFSSARCEGSAEGAALCTICLPFPVRLRNKPPSFHPFVSSLISFNYFISLFSAI